jgi:outer membrane protein OmpA-like peptidoglycan-associated protein
LVAKGIAPERLLPKGFGDTQPVASNTTAAGRQLNRRINFLLKETP